MSQGPIPLACIVEAIEALTLAKAALAGTQPPAQQQAWSACMGALLSLQQAVFMANITVEVKVPPERAPSVEELIASDGPRIAPFARRPLDWPSDDRPCSACYSTDCNGECMGDGLMGG